MKQAIGILLLVVAAVVYYLFEPSADSFYPRCVFLSWTGYPCAGCGMQRAIHSLLHLDVAAALRYNAFFVALVPVAGLMGVSYVLRHRWPKPYALLTGSPFLAALGVLALLWWVVRNLLGL